MALHTITHSCGHTDERQIYGTNVRGERETKAARLADQPCKECARKQRDADHAARNAAAAQAARDLGWPVLAGASDAKVAWAETIRADAHAQLRAETTRRAPATDLEQAAVDLYEQVLLRQTRAQEWIDHRTGGWRAMVREWMTPADHAALQRLTEAAAANTQQPESPPSEPEPVAPAPVAEADWWVRARLRVTSPARYEARIFQPDEELIAVQYGWAGYPIKHDAWWLTTPEKLLDRAQDVEDIPVIEADHVEVVEQLDRS